MRREITPPRKVLLNSGLETMVSHIFVSSASSSTRNFMSFSNFCGFAVSLVWQNIVTSQALFCRCVDKHLPQVKHYPVTAMTNICQIFDTLKLYFSLIFPRLPAVLPKICAIKHKTGYNKTQIRAKNELCFNMFSQWQRASWAAMKQKVGNWQNMSQFYTGNNIFPAQHKIFSHTGLLYFLFIVLL